MILPLTARIVNNPAAGSRVMEEVNVTAYGVNSNELIFNL